MPGPKAFTEQVIQSTNEVVTNATGTVIGGVSNADSGITDASHSAIMGNFMDGFELFTEDGYEINVMLGVQNNPLLPPKKSRHRKRSNRTYRRKTNRSQKSRTLPRKSPLLHLAVTELHNTRQDIFPIKQKRQGSPNTVWKMF